MCTVSMIGEHYGEKITKQYPQWPQWFPVTLPNTQPVGINWPQQPNAIVGPLVSREEFLGLKKTVDEMVELLRKAKKYDDDHNEPECEIEEKMTTLRKVAKLVGVDLDAEMRKVVSP